MALDVSGSMKNTYSCGHVHEISKKALSASLVLTDKKEVDIWVFGDNASFVGSYGIDQIDKIDCIFCKNEGTHLCRFIENEKNKIKDNALCIIFTDDDANSISAAVSGMKLRENVFWQIIVCESDVKNIELAIKGIKNVSVVQLSDYQTKTDDEISDMLLGGYIRWKSDLYLH